MLQQTAIRARDWMTSCSAGSAKTILCTCRVNGGGDIGQTGFEPDKEPAKETVKEPAREPVSLVAHTPMERTPKSSPSRSSAAGAGSVITGAGVITSTSTTVTSTGAQCRLEHRRRSHEREHRRHHQLLQRQRHRKSTLVMVGKMMIPFVGMTGVMISLLLPISQLKWAVSSEQPAYVSQMLLSPTLRKAR